MRLENFPVFLGIIATLAGIAIIADAVIPETDDVPLERRLRARPERSRVGQGLFGAALIAIAIALFAGDLWRYTTLTVGIAIVLVVVGVAMNLRYLRGLTFGPVLGRILKRRASDLGGNSEPPASIR